jgi:hypothetical protein
VTESKRRKQLEAMLADDPADPFVRYALAMEFVSEGNDEKAAQCLLDLAQQAPDYAPAYLQAGLALGRIRRTNEAKEIWIRGALVAERQGDQHAAEEMRGYAMACDSSVSPS